MRRLRLRFDRKLTHIVAELADRHGTSKANVVLSAISTYKAISDLDLLSLNDKSQPKPRFSEKLVTWAKREQEEYQPKSSAASAGAQVYEEVVSGEAAPTSGMWRPAKARPAKAGESFAETEE